MNNRTWWAVFKPKKQGRAVPAASILPSGPCVCGEAPRKTFRDRLADAIAATDGPADPADRERWLQEHARGR